MRGGNIDAAANVKVFQSACLLDAGDDDERMSNSFRNSTFARIGRSYPRPYSQPAEVEQSSFGRYRVAAALLAFLSALGLIGWFLGR